MDFDDYSNFHCFSKIIKTYYDSCLHQLSNTMIREDLLFSYIYSIDDYLNKSILIFPKQIKDKNKLRKDMNDKAHRSNNYNSIEVGVKEEIIYKYEEQEFMIKTITPLFKSKSTGNVSLIYLIIEEYFNYKEKVQYELSIDIKELLNGTFLYIEIKFPNNCLSNEIFTNEVQKKITKSIKKDSLDQKYKASHEIELFSVINSSRSKISNIMKNSAQWKYMNYESILRQNENITSVGDMYQLRSITDSNEVIYQFRVIEYYTPDNDNNTEDWRITIELFNSIPNSCICYTRGYVISYISENLSLLKFKISYISPVSYDVMCKALSDCKLFIKSIKDNFESKM